MRIASDELVMNGAYWRIVIAQGYAASRIAFPSTRIPCKIYDAVREIRSSDAVSIALSPRYR